MVIVALNMATKLQSQISLAHESVLGGWPGASYYGARPDLF